MHNDKELGLSLGTPWHTVSGPTTGRGKNVATAPWRVLVFPTGRSQFPGYQRAVGQTTDSHIVSPADVQT